MSHNDKIEFAVRALEKDEDVLVCTTDDEVSEILEEAENSSQIELCENIEQLPDEELFRFMARVDGTAPESFNGPVLATKAPDSPLDAAYMDRFVKIDM